ncbi:MAG: arginine--tRNA ligase, partial [Bacteroidaceae bacterium]|nr:arginine--tRNA ligase [Bacteroidaceae bacterium]
MEITQQIVRAVACGIKTLYGADCETSKIQLQETRPEFEGNMTLVVFPFLRASRKPAEETAREIGEYLTAEVPDVVARFNVVKGFLNLVIAPAQWIKLLQEINGQERFGFRPVTDESPLVM